MDHSPFRNLPDELLEAIIVFLPPKDTLAFGSACRRAHQLAFEHLVWRRHCLQGWRYWGEEYQLDDLEQQPPAQVHWRQLFGQRSRIDKEAAETFDALLATQQNRIERFERIAEAGYDVKDLLQKLRDDTPDDADDVLCRRYYAGAIIEQIHRRTALMKWNRLHKQQMVRLEEILGSYDLFILGGRRGDLHDIDDEFKRLAKAIRDGDDKWHERNTRQKAVRIAQYLREKQLVGNPSEEDYHALRNNFVGVALFDSQHTSLPVQSVAIYCAVARRLGVLAKPSNYPHHVHAVVEAPPDYTLDGRPRAYDPNTESFDPEVMHMDPWRSSDEIPREQLATRLSQMGAPPGQHSAYLGPASTLEVALRTGRNIMNSVQEARGRQPDQHGPVPFPDTDDAWYSMLWSMMVLGDTSAGNAAASLHRRRQCLPYLAEHFQAHHPEDLALIERLILPMFESEREQHILLHLIMTLRTADRNLKAPSPRDLPTARVVRFRVGQYFTHRRFDYLGVIVGWDTVCNAEERWITQMRVDELSRGRSQPFYNVVSFDKSVRYVAEENIEPTTGTPCPRIMALAGRYFKRWDSKSGLFVSNLREEYPDD